MDAFGSSSCANLLVLPPDDLVSLSSAHLPLLEESSGSFFEDAMAEPCGSLDPVTISKQTWTAVSDGPRCPSPDETSQWVPDDARCVPPETQTRRAIPIRNRRNGPICPKATAERSSKLREPRGKKAAPPRKSVFTSEKQQKQTQKLQLQQKESIACGGSRLSETPDVSRDPRRRRILERNRVAATKCRLRKRDEASALAAREHDLQDQNRYLSSCFDALTSEVYRLKSQLFQHTDCKCVLIQKYITAEAKKSLDIMVGVPSSPGQASTSPEFGHSSRNSISDGVNFHSPGDESVQTLWSGGLPLTGDEGELPDSTEWFNMAIGGCAKGSLTPGDDGLRSSPRIIDSPMGGSMEALCVDMTGPQPQTLDAAIRDRFWAFL